MSESKHFNSKGHQNSNSKNPIARSGIRSFGLPHSPAAGSISEGGQRLQEAPFVKAIVKYITKSAKEFRVILDFNSVVSFANDYASRMHGKMYKFQQSDVEQALKVFQDSYQPPAPAPSPPPPQPRNPNNLFGQLMAVAKFWNLPRDVLISWLKYYITQPGIVEIAENPTKQDVTFGYEEMVRAISPGIIKFRKVLEQGLSAESMGVNEFKQFIQNNPPIGYIWAFNNCPSLGTIQKEICTSQSSDLSNICCFIEGFIFNPNGSISFFKQKNILGLQHIFNKPAFIWLANVGTYIIPGYRGKNGYIIVSEKRNDDPNYGIPSRIDEITVYHDQRIFANPIYQSNCQTAMAKIGGIPVSIVFSEQQEAAEAVLSSSEPQVQQATRECKHGIWGGGEVLGKCIKCDWGQQ